MIQGKGTLVYGAGEKILAYLSFLSKTSAIAVRAECLQTESGLLVDVWIAEPQKIRNLSIDPPTKFKGERVYAEIFVGNEGSIVSRNSTPIEANKLLLLQVIASSIGEMLSQLIDSPDAKSVGWQEGQIKLDVSKEKSLHEEFVKITKLFNH